MFVLLAIIFFPLERQEKITLQDHIQTVKTTHQAVQNEKGVYQ